LSGTILQTLLPHLRLPLTTAQLLSCHLGLARTHLPTTGTIPQSLLEHHPLLLHDALL
jgi:hypothetical protein